MILNRYRRTVCAAKGATMHRPEIEASPVVLPSEGLKHSRFFFNGHLVTFLV